MLHRLKQNSRDSPCADPFRADTGVISVRGLHLHHPLCHSAVDGRARGRLLQGHRHGWQRHPADMHEPGHQLPDQWTGLWPELRGARDARVRELHQHDEHHVGHVSDWWETVNTEERDKGYDTLVNFNKFNLIENVWPHLNHLLSYFVKLSSYESTFLPPLIT